MAQATQAWNGITVYRWHVHTTRGRRTTWKVSAEGAKQAAEAIGLTVLAVEPAGSAIDERVSGLVSKTTESTP